MEADLPDIVDYKAERLAGARPRCRLERVAVDLADGAARRELLDRVAAGRPTLVVAEGVLLYLAPEDVATLGRELAERAGFRWWLLDLSSPCFVEWFNRMFGRPLAAAGATFRFAPAEGADFFRPLGWTPIENRSGWEEARRLDREPRLWRLVRAVSRRWYRDLARYVLLERA